MVDCANVWYAISFFQGVSKISSKSTTDTNCCKVFAKMRKLFYCCITVEELRLCIKNLVEDFCNLRAGAFVKVFDVYEAALFFWRLYDSLKDCVVRNIKTAGPDSGFKAFAVNRDYRNRQLRIKVNCNTVYVFSCYS